MLPSTSVQPVMFQLPSCGAEAAARGVSGEKLLRCTEPLNSGTTPTIVIGMMIARPIHFCTFAVPRMPRCWIAKTISISTAPTKKEALKEKLTGPIVCEKAVQLRMAGVSAAMAAAVLSAALPCRVAACAAIHCATSGALS